MRTFWSLPNGLLRFAATWWRTLHEQVRPSLWSTLRMDAAVGAAALDPQQCSWTTAHTLDSRVAMRILSALCATSLLIPPTVLSAQDAHPVSLVTGVEMQAISTSRKSPRLAALLSLGTTASLATAGYLIADRNADITGTGAWIAFTGLGIGPSIGSAYAGNYGHAVRHILIGGGMLAGAFATYCPESCDDDENLVPLAFAIGYLVNLVWATATGVIDVGTHNRRLGEAALYLVPQRDGRLALGCSVGF